MPLLLAAIDRIQILSIAMTSEEVFMNRVGKGPAEYSAPKLTRYGDMAKLTAGGTGSVTEAASGNMSANFKA